MLLTWMVYAVVFGSLTYGAAFAADRIAATWGRRQRLAWVAAVGVATVIPVIFATQPRSPASVTTGLTSVASPGIGTSVSIAVAASRSPDRETLQARARRLVAASDAYLVGGWVLGSIVWLALLARAAIGLRRRRAHWREVEVDGTTVLVAPGVGPAVMGALAPRVVIPQWALSLNPQARALMLRHEAEHIRARDPLLVLSAAFATALFPWNPALWLLARRLRLAIEIDCDARVLRTSADRREYGELLLTVGARRSAPLPFATSLAERRPFLERRIRAMSSVTPRHPRIVSAICLAVVAGATTAAVRAPRPTPLVTPTTIAARRLPQPEAVLPNLASVATAKAPTPAPTASKPVVQSHSLSDTPGVKLTAVERPRARRGPDTLTVEEIRTLIAAHHPSVATGDPDINTITLIVNAHGDYVVSAAESRPFAAGGGRVGRGGRVGGGDGIGAGMGARGRVGGGRAAAQDSAAIGVVAKRVTMMLETLPYAVGDPLVVRQRTETIVDGIVSSTDSTKVLTALEFNYVADLLGLNSGVVSRLIDPRTIGSIQIHTFEAGELGLTRLVVFVIRQKP